MIISQSKVWNWNRTSKIENYRSEIDNSQSATWNLNTNNENKKLIFNLLNESSKFENNFNDDQNENREKFIKNV